MGCVVGGSCPAVGAVFTLSIGAALMACSVDRCLSVVVFRCMCQWVAVCRLCGRVELFVACVVLLACDGGLSLFACACAYGGFLLQDLLVSINQLLRQIVSMPLLCLMQGLTVEACHYAPAVSSPSFAEIF